MTGRVLGLRILLVLVGVAVGCRGETLPSAMANPTIEASALIDPLKTQLVTIVSEDWDRFRAQLRRYERAPGEAWRPVGQAIDVVLGREGYGWGRGVHGGGPPPGRSGPIKREGDGRSPAGVFEIGTAFGYPDAMEGVALPYMQATHELRCVDDPKSLHYNRIVSTADVSADWDSAEHMRRHDDLYSIAIVVRHNTEYTEPGAGSCIFIHVWKGPDRGMSGCTAMPKDVLEAIAAWLRPDVALVVALPRGEYDALQREWGLPLALAR